MDILFEFLVINIKSEATSMLCGQEAELVGLVCQVLPFQPAAIQAKAVTTAASMPVMERK